MFNGILQQSFLSVAKREWLSWLSCAIAAFFAASLLISGWPQGLMPEITTPYSYGGDGISYLWNIKRVVEGAWYFENAHTGFPFGSNHLDYPTADTGSYLALKVLGTLFNSAVAAANLYYLLGFALCAGVTYIVSRTLGISRRFAVVNSLLYALTSFHFGRIGHLFFTWYFVAPLFFYFGFKLFSVQTGIVSWKNRLVDGAALVVLASFGIYYALFGCMVLFVCCVLAALLHSSWQRLGAGLLSMGFVVFGVLVNVSPSLVYLTVHGENREGVNRLASESELYALKITQLLLPRADHRIEFLDEFADYYNHSFPLVTENVSASLGVMGSLGFLLLLVLIFVRPMLRSDSATPSNTASLHPSSAQSPVLLVLGLVTLSLVLMATVGGFSSLFAMLVSTSIRSWNRISIFIAFASVTACMIAVDGLMMRFIKFRNKNLQAVVFIALSAIILIVGVLDQTIKPCRSCMAVNKALFQNDQNFIQTVEKALPPNAAIYQLPYVSYPENGPVNGLGSYDQARGHLHSANLNWSFGGMRGRDGDWFFRKISHLPMEQQVVIVKALGFNGIYIDRRGYLSEAPMSGALAERCEDHTGTDAASHVKRAKTSCLTVREVESAIEATGTLKPLVSGDKQLSFFAFKPEDVTSAAKTTQTALANQYLKPIEFEIVNGKPVVTEGFVEAIDFRDEDLPAYLGSVTGLSGVSTVNGQDTGRWSDAFQAKRVTLWFSRALPQKFTLTLTAQAGGPNAGKPLQIKVGKQVKELVFDAKFETKSVSFELTEPNEQVTKIVFKPYDPFSPAARWGSDDVRLVAVEFQKMTITIQK